MFDWSCAVECEAPYQEADDSDLAGNIVETQIVAIARGRTSSEAIANAAFIVRACNSFDELVEALYVFLADVRERDATGVSTISRSELINIGRTALAKARGETP